MPTAITRNTRMSHMDGPPRRGLGGVAVGSTRIGSCLGNGFASGGTTGGMPLSSGGGGAAEASGGFAVTSASPQRGQNLLALESVSLQEGHCRRSSEFIVGGSLGLQRLAAILAELVHQLHRGLAT